MKPDDEMDELLDAAQEALEAAAFALLGFWLFAMWVPL